MRHILPIILTLCLGAASTASAGPWLREKGSTFSSVSVTGTYALDLGTGTYLEYGLRDNLTIGADISTLTSSTKERSGIATLFMRRPLGAGDGKHRWAYELGIGASWDDSQIKPHLKTGISWGKGYQFRDKNGWMTVDAALIWDLAASQHSAKVDATLGLNFSDVTTGMVQLYLSHLDHQFFATLAPSVVFKPRKRKFKIQFGAEMPTEDMKNTALKLGIWREF